MVGANQAAPRHGAIRLVVFGPVDDLAVHVYRGVYRDLHVSGAVNQNCENAGALSTEALRSHVATASGIGGENPENYVSVLVAPFYDSTPTGPSLPGGILPGVPDYIVLAASVMVKARTSSCRVVSLRFISRPPWPPA